MPPSIVADKTAGLHAVSAIAAALLHRERTGQGQMIEVPMVEVMVSFPAVAHLAGQSFVPPERPCGYDRLLTPWRRPDRAADGYIAVMPYNAAHWKAVFQAAERPDGGRMDGPAGSAADPLFPGPPPRRSAE